MTASSAYPRFKRLVSAHELHLFFAPTREEAARAAERMDADGDQLALLLALKSYQRIGRFPRPEEYPEAVVDFVRRAVELPEDTPVMADGRTAVRKRRVVHSSTLDGLGLLSQTRVQSRRLSSRRGRRTGLLAGNRIAINGVGGGRAVNWRAMRAIQVYEVGGPEVLQEAEVDQPRPGPGEAIVEVAASGVNFLDVYHREGRYSLPLPFTPGTEGAGTVVEVGPGVADVAVGDRVGWVEIPGTYAERAVVDSSRLVPLPDDIGFETAAAVLLQGMTAHYLVKDAYPVQGGDTVLVHAAAGGMGLLLTQLITHLGGRVIGTTSTTAKAELAKRAGAAEVILSSAVDDLAAEVRRLNGGQGLPVVFDGVGAHTFDASLASLRPRGHLVLFGAASGAVPPFDPMRLAHGGSLTLIRPSLGHFIADRSELLRRAADVFEWVRSKALEVTVTGRYALSEAAQAHSDLEARRTTGKLLVVPDAAAIGRREETQS